MLEYARLDGVGLRPYPSCHVISNSVSNSVSPKRNSKRNSKRNLHYLPEEHSKQPNAREAQQCMRSLALPCVALRALRASCGLHRVKRICYSVFAFAKYRIPASFGRVKPINITTCYGTHWSWRSGLRN
jgi:hypothetical protein